MKKCKTCGVELTEENKYWDRLLCRPCALKERNERQRNARRMAGYTPREKGNGVDKLYLTKGNVAMIDPEDYERCTKHTWGLSNRGYAQARIHKKLFLLHRFLMKAPKDMVVDHINGDKLDNRRSNLRVCTQAENLRNRTSAQQNSKTGILGVCWDKAAKKYHAKITINQKTICLGLFKTLEEAKDARIEAEKKYFGEFAPSFR